MTSGIKIDAKGRKTIAVIDGLSNNFEKGIRKAGFLIGRDLVSFANKKILEKPKKIKRHWLKKLILT